MLYYKVPLDPKRYGIQFPSHNYVNWRKQMKLKSQLNVSNYTNCWSMV